MSVRPDKTVRTEGRASQPQADHARAHVTTTSADPAPGVVAGASNQAVQARALGTPHTGPLDGGTADFFSRSYGTDLRGVRVNDPSSLTALDGARGVTVGPRVALAPGLSSRPTEHRRVLAHELAHVAQQQRGRQGRPAPAGPEHERQADAAAKAVLEGRSPPRLSAVRPGSVQRDGPSPSAQRAAAATDLLAHYPQLIEALTVEQLDTLCAAVEQARAAPQSSAGSGGQAAAATTATTNTTASTTTSATVSVPLQRLLAPDSRYEDRDLWQEVAAAFREGDAYQAGALIRGIIVRRWFNDNSIDPAVNAIDISVLGGGRPGSPPQLRFSLDSVVSVQHNGGLITIQALDQAVENARLEYIVPEISDDARHLGEAVGLEKTKQRLDERVPRFVSRVRSHFAETALREIGGFLTAVQNARQTALGMVGSSPLPSGFDTVPAGLQTHVNTLSTLLSEARRWHRLHQPEMTNQEAYEWAGTELVSYADRHWDEGNYGRGILGYAGAGVVAVFEGLGNIFTFGYQSSRGDIVTAYRRGIVSYNTMEDLSETAAWRSLTVGVVTVALTFATAGLGTAAAGGLHLTRGSLSYFLVSQGVAGGSTALGMTLTETAFTESVDFSDPYAQAVWSRGSHGVGETLMMTGLGVGFGMLGGARAWQLSRAAPQTGAMVLSETELAAGPQVWEVSPPIVDAAAGEIAWVGRHATSGQFYRLAYNPRGGVVVFEEMATRRAVTIRVVEPPPALVGELPAATGLNPFQPFAPARGPLNLLTSGGYGSARPWPGGFGPGGAFGESPIGLLTGRTPSGLLLAEPTLPALRPISAPGPLLPTGPTSGPVMMGTLGDVVVLEGGAGVLQRGPIITPAPAQPAGLLGPGRPVTRTLAQVRNVRGAGHWQAGETWVQEVYGSPGQRHFNVPQQGEITGAGGRFVDAPVDLSGGRILANEVKTYLRWRTVGGQPQQQTVPLSEKIRQQVLKDVWLRENVPGYDPRWLFTDAPPSPELMQFLNEHNIVSVVYH